MAGNLEATAVPSGPTSAATNYDNPKIGSLTELQRMKDKIEQELTLLSRLLDAAHVDMNTPLVTPDDFPRDDIDVVQIRTARARIICLRNDYKDVMGRIESLLHEIFAGLDGTNDPTGEGLKEATAHVGVTVGRADPAGGPTSVAKLDRPFGKVGSVADNSPAATAGLLVGDEIRNFGPVNWQNHDGLRKVASLVESSDGSSILVNVCRRDDASGRTREEGILLMPRQGWGGPGLLGCRILPL